MLFIQMNLFYVIYVGLMESYATKLQKGMELTCEFLLVIICYFYLLLVNIVTDKKARNLVSYLILLFAGLIMILNLGLILAISVNKL